MKPINFYEAVYAVARAIPAGKVTTYGAIATWLGGPRAARAVGYALAADSCSDVPWHRVINHRGAISEGGAPWRAGEQLRRLQGENVTFSPGGTVDLERYGFVPDRRHVRRWLQLGDKLRSHRTLAARAC